MKEIEPEAVADERLPSKLELVHAFLKEAGRVAKRTQRTGMGKFWTFLFVAGTVPSAFETMMGAARFLGGDALFPLFAIVPVTFFFLCVKADFYVIGHFAQSYEWKDRVRLLSIFTERISHTRVRNRFSKGVIGASLFLCGFAAFMLRLGMFIFFTQEDVPHHWGKRLLYIGAALRIVYTYVGIHLIASWMQHIF